MDKGIFEKTVPKNEMNNTVSIPYRICSFDLRNYVSILKINLSKIMLSVAVYERNYIRTLFDIYERN